MKSGVSWVYKCTVSRALWAGRLSAWLQYVTLCWKLKYFVVNIWILITRVINNIFLWNLAILSQIIICIIKHTRHAIWLGCVRIWHFYRTLSRVTVFSWTQCILGTSVPCCGAEYLRALRGKIYWWSIVTLQKSCWINLSFLKSFLGNPTSQPTAVTWTWNVWNWWVLWVKSSTTV